ncbi:uncharacterized protein DUF1127 [Hoeflea marina]|uniref:Uncharacterized protein DUF1127 n=1 Tax=Hoeflea marina TaxID=274592 RepID=A0A317PRP9_9HYPH|nr:DUF1127 domain-containing protein [Hoeflea marina]PWW01564.1 uncharacterized protein DUF1127 [Hoeflea marina]
MSQNTCTATPLHAANSVRTAATGSVRFNAMRQLRKLAQAFRNRINARALDKLSDRELADIGLTRIDVRMAFRSGPSVDPTTEMARRARANTRTMSI